MYKKIVFILVFFSTRVFADGFLEHRSELKTGYVVSDNRIETEDYSVEIPSNKIEILNFFPKMSYLESGDVHCVVEFFVQYCQVSTNFHSYEFARNIDNSKLERLCLHFLDADEHEILTIPCVVDGQDVIWDMICIRLVQIHGSFILTHGRCEYLGGRAFKIYISDKRGNLLTDNNHKIVYNLTKRNISNLIEKPLDAMKQKVKNGGEQ